MRSSPMSTKAACMPGRTREIRPLYMLLIRPRLPARSMYTSCSTPFSNKAARTSLGVTLTRISSFGDSSGMRVFQMRWQNGQTCRDE